MAQSRVEAVLINDQAEHFTHRRLIAELAETNRLPLMSSSLDIVEVGGLIAYQPDNHVLFRYLASCVDRILRGEKPGEIPILQAAAFKLGINLKTAQALGLVIPPSFLARADLVIEQPIHFRPWHETDMPPWSPHVCCRGNNRSCVSGASGAAFDPPRTLGRLDRCGKIAYARVENIGTGLAMKRREFITLLGGAAAVWPVAARTQQPRRVPVVGVLWHAASAEEEVAFSRPLKEGFTDLGYVEGKTIVFLERYPAEEKERFDAYAIELVGLKVDALIAGSVPAAFACQRATSTIPIILVANPDPVGLKLVSSLARPGGNITGLSAMAFDLAAKRVQLLKEAIPALSRVALLVNPSNPNDANRLISELQPTADRLQVSFEAIEARTPAELKGAFEKIAAGDFGAVVVAQNAMYFNERRQIADIAQTNRIATMVPADVFVEAGALMSYGPSWPAIFRNAAGYVDQILKGTNPADMPVQQPTKFELAINLKTAKVIGKDVPPTMIARADKVIE